MKIDGQRNWRIEQSTQQVECAFDLSPVTSELAPRHINELVEHLDTNHAAIRD